MIHMGNIDLLEDACEKLAHTTRAMFGGHGLFAPNGGMFAGIVDDDRIILKLAQEPERGELIALGGAPWVYNGKMTMKDWIVIPEAFYDEPATLAEWARKAWRIAPAKKAKGSAKGAKAAKGAKGSPSVKKAKSAKRATKPSASKSRRSGSGPAKAAKRGRDSQERR